MIAGARTQLPTVQSKCAMNIRSLLELDLWDSLTNSERVAVAKAVADSLSPFILDGLQIHSLGDQTHEIAFFRYENARFALLPGRSPATLGYDRTNPPKLTPVHAADWQSSYGQEFGVTFEGVLDEWQTPLRQVSIAPLLMEVIATAVEFGQDGAGAIDDCSGIERVCGDLFRLPTADEREYACAAGTRTLFRWGKECPVSCSHDEKIWNLHKQPNAFGLLMNANTYSLEICEGPCFRGGDGGSTVHEGIGKVVTWIPLASSFFVPDDEVEGWCIEDVFVRRVRTVTIPD